MHLYRNERIPPYEFLKDLKRVDDGLYPVYDSASMRWDIYYSNPYEQQVFHVYRVCDRDHEGRDIGYRPLDNRTIQDLLRMDMKRRNISGEEYTRRVGVADDEREKKDLQKYNEDIDYVYKHEQHTLNRAFDALKGVYRRF